MAVNGQPWEKPIAPGEFLTIERQWSAGDRVTLDMPMSWRLVLGRKRQSGRAAVMRGPLVFCLNPAQKESLQRPGRGRPGRNRASIRRRLKDLPGDAAVRPGGMACRVRAGDDLIAVGVSGNLSLVLTEFADPEGKCVYFRLPDLSAAVPDELAGK